MTRFSSTIKRLAGNYINIYYIFIYFMHIYTYMYIYNIKCEGKELKEN